MNVRARGDVGVCLVHVPSKQHPCFSALRDSHIVCSGAGEAGFGSKARGYVSTEGEKAKAKAECQLGMGYGELKHTSRRAKVKLAWPGKYHDREYLQSENC